MKNSTFRVLLSGAFSFKIQAERRNQMDQVKIGKFIAEERKSQSLTQRQLADTLSISDKTVSKWETGERSTGGISYAAAVQCIAHNSQ